MFLYLLIVIAVLFQVSNAAAPSLGQYRISDVTVSGLSSGAYMAVQMHIAFSSTIRGAAIYAGGPYYCAQGSVNTAQMSCMATYMGAPNASTFINFTKKAASSGLIDDPSNLSQFGHKAYLFSGSVDSVVTPPVMKSLNDYYLGFLSPSQISSTFDFKAEHCIPTLSFGEACTTKSSPYIGKCGFDGAGAGLRHLYSQEIQPGVADSSHLLSFDQTPFAPAKSSLGDTGYIYVPTSCAQGAVCKLHVAIHGCLQDIKNIGTQWAVSAGYNSWAEANDIIVLYPYATSSTSPSNPNACWDWWGYTGADYVYKTGAQMKFLKSLIDHVRGDSNPVPAPVPVPVPSPVPAPVSTPTLPPVSPVPAPTNPDPVPEPVPVPAPSSPSTCTEFIGCGWDHYNEGRAIFSPSYTNYWAKGSNQDLGLTGYCGGAVGNNNKITLHSNDQPDYYVKGSC